MKRDPLHYSSSPLLASATPLWRSKALVAFWALCFLGLIGRAGYIQLVKPDFYMEEGAKRFVRTVKLPAIRGQILDRNGVPLASSVLAPSVEAKSDDVRKAGTPVLRKLAATLGMSLGQLRKKLKASNYVWLARQVDEKTANAVKKLNIEGILIRNEYKRWYPNSEAYAQVVGLTDVDGKGRSGIERMMEERLAGKPGSRKVIRNRLKAAVETVGYTQPAEQGKDVQLSIDSKVQYEAYDYLKQAVLDKRAKSGSVVVLDVQSGEVLAMTNYPSFNPTDIEQRKRLTGEGLARLMRNRAVSDQMEPGSTMKPFTVAAALDKGTFRPQDTIDTGKGRLRLDKFTISDTKRHGVISVSEVVQLSSNVGTVKIAKEMSAYDMWSVFNHAGFGQRPDLEFPGVVSGALRPYKDWSDVEKYTMGYGYGMSASVFQLAHAYSVFANDGMLVPATLLKAEHLRPGVQVVNNATARDVRQMLYSVVQKKGTAPQAQPEGYYVGGKTGTVYKIENGKYNKKKYRSFFVGLAPINKPRIAVAVMIDEPEKGRHYGGKAAAPVFASVVQYTLSSMGLPPERSVKQQVAKGKDVVGVSGEGVVQ